MSFLVHNLPPVQCFVKKEFLYDFEKGHGELEPCWWVSIKSLRGQAFRIEAYLNEYGALYDKLPLHACPCGSKVFSILATFDNFEISWYMLDATCANCGNLIVVPCPVDDPAREI